MSSVNKVILVGNLGKDPEVRHIGEGVAVANFSLATTETYWDRNANEKREQTEWHNIVLWRGLAEVAEKYLKKGHKVYIEGRLRSRSYEDKEGQTRYITEIVGDNMVMLTPKSSDGRHDNSAYDMEPARKGEYQKATAPDNGTPDLSGANMEDDLPF